jgi:sugar lactone lactonase YvrE
MLKFINKYSFLLFIIILVNISGCSRDPSNNPPPPPPPPAANAPTITNFFPASGITGAQVVIDGTNFSSSAQDNIVKFNGVVASIINASSTQLTVTVPNTATTGKISVTVNNKNAISIPDFIVLGPPTITSFAPTNGRPGDQVIITGTNFNLLLATNIVKFNGATATVTYGSSTQLTVIVPPNATSGTISVTANTLITTSVSIFTVFDSQVSTFAGSGTSGLVNAIGTAAQFSYPEGIAKDASGNFYVADQYNRSIRKITPGGLVSTVATFSNPSSVLTGVALDAAGNIYVTDHGINIIWKISTSGVITALAGSGLQGSADGQGAAATFKYPTDLAVDASGNVFVTDAGNRKIRKITPGGLVSTFAGSDTSYTYDGTGLASFFIVPRGITIDGAGNLYVTDYEKIRKITPAALVSTIAGSTGGFADGPVATAKFFNPKGIALDAAGNIYITDKTRIRKISTDGFVITIAGTGNYGFADGPGSVAEFDIAEGVVVDASGALFIADNLNHRIRKIIF